MAVGIASRRRRIERSGGFPLPVSAERTDRLGCLEKRPADAVWVVDGRGSFHGPSDITALFVRLRERQEFAVQRIVSGRVEFGAERSRATGRWVIHSLTRTAGSGAELVGVYDDEYVRESDGWRFRERAFTPLYRGPVALEGAVFAPPRAE